MFKTGDGKTEIQRRQTTNIAVPVWMYIESKCVARSRTLVVCIFCSVAHGKLRNLTDSVFAPLPRHTLKIHPLET